MASRKIHNRKSIQSLQVQKPKITSFLFQRLYEIKSSVLLEEEENFQK